MQRSLELTKENWHEDLITNLAESLKPEVYVELGLYHCELFNKIIPHAEKLYGVDINSEAGQWMMQSEKTFFFHGTTDEFAAEIESQKIKIDLLFIDADHSKESVLKDFWNFFPFVEDHGIILLHDTHPKNLQYTDKGYCGNAFLVIDELKQHQDKFELMTIPIHPGLTIIRKKTTHLRLETTLGFIGASYINDPKLLEKIKKVCYSEVDVRAGWIGLGLPQTDKKEYVGLAKWSTQHWAMYYSFLQMIDTESKSEVLDIGCGIGHSTLCLSEIINKKVIGIDFDEEAIRFAETYNLNDKTTYVHRDFFEYEADNKFQYIFALEILEHISPSKHYLFIDKCLSLLSEDGILFVTTPNGLDEEDAEYGHIGFLNRERAKLFIEKYKDNFIEANFIDNSKLLSGGPRSFVKKIEISQFDSKSENLSHFRLVFQKYRDGRNKNISYTNCIKEIGKTFYAADDSDDLENHLNKSITMPAFASKVKQMFPNENDIKTIVEIGALDAQDSQYFKKVFPQANVYAVEALPDNYNKYLKNLKDITPINAVVSNVDGEVNFFKKEINGIHGIFNRGDEYGTEVIKLNSYRFETLAEKYGIRKIDMLKLDVEGATVEALEGMGELLSEIKIMHLESESYPFFQGQKLHGEVVKFLEEKDFTLLELTSFPIQKGRLQFDSVWINNKYLNDQTVKCESEMEEPRESIPHYKIICITQIYNELRKENLERFWKYLEPVVDGLVVYDDGSSDGSYEYLSDKAIFILKDGENDFKNEINHKKVLLETALQLNPDFILWLDADEVLTADAAEELQKLCAYADANEVDGISFHELNLWRSNSFMRLDNSYNDGWFVRLWRVTPDLKFISQKPGLHQQQYPDSIKKIEKTDSVAVIHYGFSSDRSLAFKYLVYRSHGQNGWALQRLLDESTLQLQQLPQEIFPEGLFKEEPQPEKRSFDEAVTSLEKYREEVFKPRISIVCLIYKSVEWLEFVYQQVMKFTNLSDKEFFFIANDATDDVLKYLKENYIPYYEWNNTAEQKKEWYINNVYRAWNFGAEKAKGDYLLFINSDMAFSPEWFGNLFNKLDGSNCITSRLIESGKLLSGKYGVSKNFGRLSSDYNENGFLEYAKTISEEKLYDGGLFMPLLIKRDNFLNVGGYPEGNIVPDSNLFNPVIAKQGEQCKSGDVVLMEKLSSQGIYHKTAFDSLVYHFQCGEMDSKGDLKTKNVLNRVVVANDYLQGRMGEKTMWGFLLDGLPNSSGVDMDILGTTENFTENASKYISKNFPDSSIVIQNATFIDRLSENNFTICYLQDNLRAMGRKSHQQEANLKYADLLVTNSKLTALSYPDYDFEIIPIGVDDSLFKPMDKEKLRKEFNLPNMQTGIFVGDFSETKGWPKVKELVDNHTEIFWILVSKDNQDYSGRNCKTYNRLQQDVLSKLLNCADFFILGSPVETQCLAAIEACLCNLPIIMRNTGIFADFSEEEKSKVGIFGEDFEFALEKITKTNFTPRKFIIEKGLTVNGMIKKWEKVIQSARLKRDSSAKSKTQEQLPLFTVVVPTYNQAQYLGAALDSLLAQTFQNWEAVVVNDGSTDNTRDVMDQYKSIDKRFRFFNKENGGVATALNVGIENARGEWICWLSSDDWYEADKLEHHYNAIAEYPDIKFFISHWFIYLEQTGQKIKQGLWLDIPEKEFQVTRFFWANYVHGNSIAINKSVFQNVGVFDEALRQGQDFDMWIRIAAKYQVHFINERTCVTRIHPTQTTNTFVEGGVLDSTRSLFKFLNNCMFEELFPFLDLSVPQNALKAVNEIIFVTTKDNAFIYKAGFTSALIDKTLVWLNKQPLQLKTKLREKITEIVTFHFAYTLHPEVRKLMNKFLAKKSLSSDKHDFIEDGMKYVKELLELGDQKKAKAIETYFNKISSQTADDLINSKKFQPNVFGYPEIEKYTLLNASHIQSWFIQPGSSYANSVLHKISFNCPECGSLAKINLEYEMTAGESESKFICPACKTGLLYNDENLNHDLVDFNRHKKHKEVLIPNSRVAFFIASAAVIGGGSRILFKYINWINALGVDVTLYSFSPKPDWAEVSVKFIQLNEASKIDGSLFSRIFVFSIYDVPLMLNYVPLEKIVHICQGYEGYHYGTTYEEMRSDKHVLTEVHTVPVKNIVVSKHLSDLFKEKFDRETEYVPNGVDHKIFYPDFNLVAKEKAIAFVGNPKHLLKGFHFLTHVIRTVQNSHLRIHDLKLYVVLGFELQDSAEIREKLEIELNCKVELLMRQSSDKVADLMRRVRAVVCTSWYEGFSLPLLEGMACGTPVISTRNMGAESFCKSGFNSFLINHGDSSELISKLLDVLYLKFDHEEILENAFATSLDYSEYKSANYFISAIEKLLGLSIHDKLKQKLLSAYQDYSRLDFAGIIKTVSDEKKSLSINDHIAKSNFYIKENNFEQALKHLEQALNLFGEDTSAAGYIDLLNFTGNLNYVLGDFDKAQEYFEKQLALSPESSSACLGLGEVLLAKDMTEGAKVMFEWAVKNDTNNQKAVEALTKANSILGLELTHNTLLLEV